jgi:GDP-4-dehydro-6-deoxy-D-mannose reductase
MKSLIIGGAGFVGAYLVQHLKEELGHEVVVTKMETESIVLNGVEIHNMDILKKNDIVELFQKVRPDYIFHLAAQSSVSVSWNNPQLTVDVNIKGGVNVLEALRELDYKPRMLLIGSGEEYGHIRKEETPIGEDNNTRPGNIYAATKTCQNMLGKIYADAYNLDVMMVRAFNHLGPNQAPLFVAADFCKQVAEIESKKRDAVIKVGNLSAKRDFTDVRDVVRCYGLIMQKGKAGETYNVGSGHAISIEELLQMILNASTAQIKVEVDPQKLRPIDVPIIEANIEKVVAATGWKPEIPLERTILETLNYWRNVISREG